MPTLIRSAASDSRQRPTVGIAWMYLIALLGTVFMCVTAITVIVVMSPQADNTGLVTIIVEFGITSFTAAVAAIKAQEAKHVAKETGYRVDGRIGDLLEAIAKQKEMEGIIKGAGIAATATAAATPAPSPESVTPKES